MHYCMWSVRGAATTPIRNLAKGSPFWRMRVKDIEMESREPRLLVGVT
jgi:hypothetical protein